MSNRVSMEGLDECPLPYICETVCLNVFAPNVIINQYSPSLIFGGVSLVNLSSDSLGNGNVITDRFLDVGGSGDFPSSIGMNVSLIGNSRGGGRVS